MKLPWEYCEAGKYYTVKMQLGILSIWISVSSSQIVINVSDDCNAFSYGNFTDTKDLEKRIAEIEALISNISSRDLADFCSHLMKDIKTLKRDT